MTCTTRSPVSRSARVRLEMDATVEVNHWFPKEQHLMSSILLVNHKYVTQTLILAGNKRSARGVISMARVERNNFATQ